MPPVRVHRKKPAPAIAKKEPSRQFLSREIKLLLVIVTILALALLVLLMVFTSFFLSSSTTDLALQKNVQTKISNGPSAVQIKHALLEPEDAKSQATGTATISLENGKTALQISAQSLPKAKESQAYAVYLLGTKGVSRQFIGRIVQTSVGSAVPTYTMQGVGPADWFSATGLEIVLQNVINPKRAELTTVSGTFIVQDK
jgi:hypothetical protein